LAAINNLSPLKYYQGGSALDGLNWGYWLGTMGVTLALAVLAWLVFLRRDIRVSGEGAGLQWGNWARREAIHER
jgi:hypothetical protein